MLSNGAHTIAMSGQLKAAVTIQFAETKLALTKRDVRGSTTSQVMFGNVFNN